MKKVSLIIADPDTSYIESLAHYIRNSEFISKFDVKLFSHKDRLEQFLSGEKHIDVLLTNTKLLPENVDRFPADSVITLKENKDDEYTKQDLFKYQPISSLLSQVLSIHYEQSDQTFEKVVKKGNTQLISIYSASGGAGKTTVAINLAKQIAAQNKRVFYLNLELINSTPLLFNMEQELPSSPLLNLLKNKSEQLTSKLNEMKATDRSTNIDFFNVLLSGQEMADLTEDEIDLLIKKLVNSGNYNYIIIDLDSTVNSSVITALKKSDYIVWLLNNDIQSFHKTRYLLEELHGILNDGRFSNRVSFVLNRYTGKLDVKLANFGLKIDAFLPLVPQWKEVLSGSEITSISVFNEYIGKLYQHLSDQ
ncbi:AAA family ATPase [Aquibacillus rhizosphaerae]|uniref:AAA family ATPase n=1 Tax=Aquibacillus rhizosphaerae TaxID=3051431 RepID=A0ABT7KZM5_9BACI|nr:AAA family ATPase [Aquibacillus sp. LR5S19]MDL4838919.1 AAA family ATPase [Aquibacillus sp. LR5S19]